MFETVIEVLCFLVLSTSLYVITLAVCLSLFSIIVGFKFLQLSTIGFSFSSAGSAGEKTHSVLPLCFGKFFL